MQASDLDNDEVGSAPPPIAFENEMPVSDFQFSPNDSVLAAGLVDGSVRLYRYALEGNTLGLALNHHRDACRCVCFSTEGKYLFTGSADKSLAAVDIAAGKPLFQKQNAHEAPLHSIASHEQLLATGDEDGGVKVWDLRQSKQIFEWNENSDFISELHIQADANTLLAPCGDGNLSVFHLRRGTVIAISDNLQDELLSVAVIKEGKKVVCGTQDGILYIWNWGEWEEPVGRFPGHPQSIDSIIAIDNDTLVTGSSDGLIRVVSVIPNKMLGVVGEHGELPIECMRRSGDKNYMATSSHDGIIKFWDVAYLHEDDEPGNMESAEIVGDDGSADMARHKQHTGSVEAMGESDEDDDDDDEEEDDSSDAEM